MTRSCRTIALAIVVAAFARPGSASAQVGKSIVGCQKAVASASGKYIEALSGTISLCLAGISTGVVQNGATPDAAAAASAEDCVAYLRRILNSETPAKELGSTFAAKVDASCDPAVNPKLVHTEADLVTVGDTTLGAADLGKYCEYFGGDGTIDSYREWRDCLQGSAECQARQAVASQWPRVLEYFEALEGAMSGLPNDRVHDDARLALAELDRAIEGHIDDDRPGIVCGGRVDATPLSSEFSICRQSWFHKPPGPCPDSPYYQDAMIRSGQARSYRDNGDGTVSDLATGLMWEKISTDGSVHDQLRTYAWADAFQKIDELNAGAGFAGHTDWRLPNRRELASLTIPALDGPCVDPAFENNCFVMDCSNVDCSCTVPFPHWTSTSYDPAPASAWQVDFNDGSVVPADKAVPAYVRAVRTGR